MDIKDYNKSLMMSSGAARLQNIGEYSGRAFLFTVTSMSVLAVLFIFIYIAKDAWPFLKENGIIELFTSSKWYPSADNPEYGALAIIYGTAMVTLGSVCVAVPLGISAAICMSDILPFSVRQYVKPVIEMLAAIPSVAFGFFALVVFAPILQDDGGAVLSSIFMILFTPLAFIIVIVASDLMADRATEKKQKMMRWIWGAVFTLILGGIIYHLQAKIACIEISSGTNALNVSFILGMMALPTIVSVAEDALQACGRELREGSYALGATRAETLIKTVIPASISGIIAACILGTMRAVGETMVVWMASGNSAKMPTPWYDITSSVKTLTATIAGDMGEAARGTHRYHVLFVLALVLLIVSFSMNLFSQWIVNRQLRKMGK